MLAKNVPVTQVENLRLYSIEKLTLNSGEYFKLETKILVEYDENDPLSNDVRKAFFIVRAEVLRNRFKGTKPSDLINKNYDLLVEFRPVTKSVNPKGGDSFQKTEWWPEVIDIVYSGAVLSEDANKPVVQDDEL